MAASIHELVHAICHDNVTAVARLHKGTIPKRPIGKAEWAPPSDWTAHGFEIDRITACRAVNRFADDLRKSEQYEFLVQWKSLNILKSNISHLGNAVIHETPMSDFVAGTRKCKEDPDSIEILWKSSWERLDDDCSFFVQQFWDTFYRENTPISEPFFTFSNELTWIGESVWRATSRAITIDEWDLGEELTIERLGEA